MKTSASICSLLALFALCCFFQPCEARTGHTRKVTIFQISDLHGWVDGHPRGPDFSMNATLADYKGLLDVIRADSISMGHEFIAIGSGDQIEGTGISDATNPPGTYIWEFCSAVGFDAQTLGNHDVFDTGAGLWLHHQIQQKRLFTNNNYITTNTWAREDGLPMGTSRFKLQVLPHSGIRVLYLGFIYNFDNINKTAFDLRDAGHVMRTDTALIANITALQPDIIIATCHIGSDDPLAHAIIGAIRAIPQFEHTPLYMATGHTHRWHTQNCTDHTGKYVEQCVMTEPGRYFEHVAITTLSMVQTKDKGWQWQGQPAPNNYESPPPTSTHVFGQLVGLVDIRKDLSTDAKALASQIEGAAKSLGLNEVAGCLPTHFNAKGWYMDKDSISYLWQEIFQAQVSPLCPQPDKTITVFNTMDARYDLFKGKNTMNDLYTSFPFDIPLWEYWVVKQATPIQIQVAMDGVKKKKDGSVDVDEDSRSSRNSTEKKWLEEEKRDTDSITQEILHKLAQEENGTFEQNPHYVSQYEDLTKLQQDEKFDIMSVQYNTMRFIRTLEKYYPGQGTGPKGEWESIPLMIASEKDDGDDDVNAKMGKDGESSTSGHRRRAAKQHHTSSSGTPLPLIPYRMTRSLFEYFKVHLQCKDE